MEYIFNDDFYSKLAQKGKFNVTEIDFLRPKVDNLVSELKSDLFNWVLHGKPSTTAIEGYTVDSLMKEKGLEFVASILTLDWLSRDPDTAKKAIEEGYDKIL